MSEKIKLEMTVLEALALLEQLAKDVDNNDRALLALRAILRAALKKALKG